MVDSPLLQFYQMQQDQGYRNQLLQLQQQNAALDRVRTMAALAQQQRQQQGQAAIAQALSQIYGQGAAQGMSQTPPPAPQQQQAPAPPLIPAPGFQQQGIPQQAPQLVPGGAAPAALRQQVLALEGNQPYAIGRAGELGPGQIKPSTGAMYGFAPSQLVGDQGRQASGTIVSDLYRQSGGDPAATLVGYNAGPGAMRKFQESGDDPTSVKLSPPYAKAVREDLSEDEQDHASQTAITSAGMLPPMMIGRAGPGIFAQLVQKVAGSNASDDVKGAALMQLLPLMSEEGQRQFQQQWEMYQFAANKQIQQQEFGIREQELQQQRQFQNEIAEQRLGQGQQRLNQQGQLGQDRVAQGAQKLSMELQKLQQAQAPSMSPQDMEFWANVVRNGGNLLPGLSRTAAGSKLVQQIMTLVPQGAGGGAGGYMANQASQKANQHSLQNMQKMADSAISFERTAKKNFELALSQSKGAVPTDWGPWLNKWIETGETQAGNTDVPPYVASLLTAADEYAKVMSGSTGSQGSTVDSRKAAAELFSPYLSSGQISRVVAIAEADMENRKSSLDEQLDFIRDRISTGASGATGATPQQAARQQGGRERPKSATQNQPQGGQDEVPLPPAFAKDPDGTGYQKGGAVWVKRGNVLVKTPGGVVTNGGQ